MWERCLPEKQLPMLPFETRRGRNNRTRDPLCRWPGTSVSPQSELCTFLDGMIASTLYRKGDALSSVGKRGLKALHSLYAVGQAVQCLFWGKRQDAVYLRRQWALLWQRGPTPYVSSSSSFISNWVGWFESRRPTEA